MRQRPEKTGRRRRRDDATVHLPIIHCAAAARSPRLLHLRPAVLPPYTFTNPLPCICHSSAAQASSVHIPKPLPCIRHDYINFAISDFLCLPSPSRRRASVALRRASVAAKYETPVRKLTSRLLTTSLGEVLLHNSSVPPILVGVEPLVTRIWPSGLGGGDWLNSSVLRLARWQTCAEASSVSSGCGRWLWVMLGGSGRSAGGKVGDERGGGRQGGRFVCVLGICGQPIGRTRWSAASGGSAADGQSFGLSEVASRRWSLFADGRLRYSDGLRDRDMCVDLLCVRVCVCEREREREREVRWWGGWVGRFINVE
ncbi:ubinuclein-2 [Striga asiatica]|uniref:Ubinuclein-2 n=1 Tax=Striga asiatica TaxID=4170 RepID=A0A5A7R417_STRAF|nr:ubinuclein-2 [Striga asiatica]